MNTNSALMATGLIDRRRLLGGGLALLGGAVLGADKAEGLLDIHVHLFGIGEGGTGCRMAKSITNGLQFRFLVEVLRCATMARPSTRAMSASSSSRSKVPA